MKFKLVFFTVILLFISPLYIFAEENVTDNEVIESEIPQNEVIESEVNTEEVQELNNNIQIVDESVLNETLLLVKNEQEFTNFLLMLIFGSVIGYVFIKGLLENWKR